jgi:GNAT superfamily N-acetyltransferase
MNHPLRVMLDAAASGRFPAPDGEIEVVPSPGDCVGAIVAFTGHFVLAAGVAPADVRARAPRGDFSVPLSPPFLTWVGERIDAVAGTHDVLLAAPAETGPLPHELEEVDAGELSHPRIDRAARYRQSLRVYATPARDALLVLGHGLCGRWECAFEVDPGARSRGLGRELARAARRLVPSDAWVWAQVAPGNAASLRAVTAAGYRPIGAEVLFTRPR